jgi:hypothetical protein
MFGLIKEIVKLPVSIVLDVTFVAQIIQILSDKDLDSETRKNLERLLKELEN